MSDDPGVKLECTCGACPEQYEGTVDGNPAYFRLRHSGWRFCIIEPGGDPVDPGSTPEKKVLYYKKGEYEPGQDAGIMEDARGLIQSMVEEFRRSLLTEEKCSVSAPYGQFGSRIVCGKPLPCPFHPPAEEK